MQNNKKLLLLRVVAVFCACLCLFSAVMTGTYAWQSQQHATNELWGPADTLIPVELVKREMEYNGNITEIPVSGAVFYLFKENGTQVGVQYETDAEGKIHVQLPPGTYYFEEAMPPYGYTYSANQWGELVSRHVFEVEEQEEPYETLELLVYNRRLEGNLIISKAVQNSDGTPLSDEQRKERFTFVVTFTEGNEIVGMPDFASNTDVPTPSDLTPTDGEKVYTYRIGNGLPQTIVSGGTLQLRSGEIAVFEGLPAGLLYNVAEKAVDGYVTTAMGHQGNIREDEPSLAAFINTCESDNTGTLVISKEVENLDGTPLTQEQKEMEFSFRLAVGQVVHEFTLKDGEQEVFRGIPLGESYLVQELTEELPTGYIAMMDTYSGTMTAAKGVELDFTNVYAPAPSADGELVVTKRVEGGEAKPEDRFMFAVTFEGENAPSSPEPFRLSDGESKSFKIPHGVTYKVTEVRPVDYLPAWNVMQGTIIGGQTAEVVAVNTVPDDPDEPHEPPPETVKITVKKELAVAAQSGGFLPSDAERSFCMTLYVNDQPTEFMLKGGESETFIVPYGASYEVREKNYFSDGFSQSITHGSGIAMGDTEVEVTNTYIGKPRVEIKGEKTWVIPEGVAVTLPESITVQLMDGTTVVAEQEVKIDDAGKWLYRFEVPLYRADGVTEIEYTIAEVSVPGFSMSPDPENTRNIINTYVAPITESDPPITIRKSVVGSNAPEAEFTFLFESRTAGAPMPEGAEGTKLKLRLLGGKEIEIGRLTFTEAGTYEYVVYEVNEGLENWSYDTSRYTITYVVTEDQDTRQLSMVRTIKKNNTETTSSQLVFTNTYALPSSNTVVISGQKKWVHRGNPVWNQPSSVIIEVYGDGRRVYQKQVTADENWRYSWTVDKYAADGHEILYTVDEQSVSGYSKKVEGYNVINTFTGTVPSVPPSVGPGWPDTPDTPNTPDTPDKPEKEPGSADTGDDSRIPFWLTMTLANMLGCIATIRAIRSGRYVGKRLKK